MLQEGKQGPNRKWVLLFGSMLNLFRTVNGQHGSGVCVLGDWVSPLLVPRDKFHCGNAIVGVQEYYHSSQGWSPDIQQSVVSKRPGYPHKAQTLFPAQGKSPTAGTHDAGIGSLQNRLGLTDIITGVVGKKNESTMFIKFRI